MPPSAATTKNTNGRSFRKSPQARAPAVQSGGFKLILGQIIGQTELLIFLILGWGTNVDLPVSRDLRRHSSFSHFVAPASLYLAGAP